MTDIEIYTDGACRGNPGPGGWGALLIAGDARRELSGYEARTTNNRMELTAAIEALRALKRPVSVTLYTDSKYVCTGIEEWLPNWKERGWRTADKKPVKNVDLWQALDEARAPHRVRWKWVRGHDGNHGNEHVDALANAAIDAMLAVTSAP
jgi:ribonuclease HI